MQRLTRIVRAAAASLGAVVGVTDSTTGEQSTPSPDRTGSRSWSAAVFFIALAVFILSPVRQISDASYSLLVSECLYRHGTFALDRYVSPSLDPAVHPGSEGGELPYHIVESRGHFFYFFPPGTSVLSVPFAMVSNLVGMSAIYPDGGYHYREERRMQIRLAALLMASFAVVVYRLGFIIVGHGWSLILVVASVFGSQVWSTASRGLWSHSWAILLVMIGIAHLLRVRVLDVRLRPVVLATLLSWACLTRPTMIVAAIAVGGILAVRHRRSLVPYLVTCLGWAGSLMAYSWVLFGSWLPPYYQGGRLGADSFIAALAGVLVSPGRGLLVYLPHLAIVAVLLWRFRRVLEFPVFVWTAVFAIAGHVLVIASFPHWWGGHGYGPRLLTDSVPWLIVLAAVGTRAWLDHNRKGVATGSRVRIRLAAALLVIVIAVIIHGVGAWSPLSNEWNRLPTDLDAHPERVWDWSDPQFLAPLIRSEDTR